jgi:transposase-like protein
MARLPVEVFHLIGQCHARAAPRYVSSEDSQEVLRDLKKKNQAASVVEAEDALNDFAQAWDTKYPTISKTWRAKWTDIITLFDLPLPIRVGP